MEIDEARELVTAYLNGRVVPPSLFAELVYHVQDCMSSNADGMFPEAEMAQNVKDLLDNYLH